MVCVLVFAWILATSGAAVISVDKTSWSSTTTSTHIPEGQGTRASNNEVTTTHTTVTLSATINTTKAIVDNKVNGESTVRTSPSDGSETLKPKPTSAKIPDANDTKNVPDGEVFPNTAKNSREEDTDKNDTEIKHGRPILDGMTFKDLEHSSDNGVLPNPAKNATGERTLSGTDKNGTEVAGQAEEVRPILDHMIFNQHHKGVPTAKPTPKHKQISMHITAAELRDYDHHLVIWVSVLGVGCFLCGIVSTALVAYVVYRRKKIKWRQSYKRRYSRPRGLPFYDIEGCHPVPKIFDATVAPPCGEFFRYKEGLTIPTGDVRTLFANHVPTSLAEEEGNNNGGVSSECQSVFPQLTTYNGSVYPFINQFSRIISAEGGEVSSPYSDVALFVAPRAIRKGTSRQIFLNVALQADTFLKEFLSKNSNDEGSKLSVNLKDLALENMNSRLVQLSPVVECISPGVRRFARPLVIRIPHRANINCSDPSTVWKLKVFHSCSPLGEGMSWTTVPTEEAADTQSTPDAVYTYDQDSAYIRTYLPGTWAILGKPLSKRSCLRLSAVAYTQCKLPPLSSTCTPQQQRLHNAINCDIQSTFPDLIVPTTSQTRCDSNPMLHSNSDNRSNPSSAPPCASSSPQPQGRPLCVNSLSSTDAQQVKICIYICDPYMDAHKVTSFYIP